MTNRRTWKCKGFLGFKHLTNPYAVAIALQTPTDWKEELKRKIEIYSAGKQDDEKYKKAFGIK